MPFREQVKRHRRSAGIVFGFAAGLAAGGVTRLAGLSGLELYGFWALTICIVLALVAPWALRGAARGVIIEESPRFEEENPGFEEESPGFEETSEPAFRLVRFWHGSEVLVASEREESSTLDNDDFDFLFDGESFEPFVLK